jgi:hypothetical protein
MAYWYYDAATGSDGNDGTSWAQAEATLQAVLSDAAAGDTIFARANSSETTKDTLATTRQFTGAGLSRNPIKVVGVKAGTINTGADIVAGDLAARSGDQPVIEVTGAGNDMRFQFSMQFSYCKITVTDRLEAEAHDIAMVFIECDLTCNSFRGSSYDANMYLIKCDMDFNELTVNNRGDTIIIGGAWIASAGTNLIGASNAPGIVDFVGVDLTAAAMTQILSKNDHQKHVRFKNCKMPATFGLNGSTHINPAGLIELIACGDGTSKASNLSYQDYIYNDIAGTIEDERTAVRTGGADDGTSSVYSLAMTPASDSTLDASKAALKCPPLRVWVTGGSELTITVYIANSTASTDYLKDEVYCIFSTPDDGDTQQHDMTFDDTGAFVLESAVAVTDDASSWGTGAANAQKFTHTFTPGFSGFCSAEVYLAKRQATPDTLYLDPQIVVT